MIILGLVKLRSKSLWQVDLGPVATGPCVQANAEIGLALEKFFLHQ
jgi:hypothetical protein